LGTSQILKQLGILDTASGMTSRRTKNTAETASETAAVPIEGDEEPAEETLDRPPKVSLLSKEQVVKLLNPGRGQATRAKGAVAQRGKSVSETSLEGKFVDLIDLLPPVPAKGEFDVNKIKSSLYFFS
jgi:DNA-directed RNA polymerase